jgi:hypothetical protein
MTKFHPAVHWADVGATPGVRVSDRAVRRFETWGSMAKKKTLGSMPKTKKDAMQRLVDSGLRQLRRNSKKKSLTSKIEESLVNAGPDDRVIIHTGSGPILYSKAPFEKTIKGRPIAYSRPLAAHYSKTLPHSYKGLSPYIDKKVAEQTLKNIRKLKHWNVSTQKATATIAPVKGQDQAAAFLTALLTGPESQRTSQDKLARATLRHMVKNKSFAANDAFTNNNAAKEAAFVQAGVGGKRKFREVFESDELSELLAKIIDEDMSSSSDETDNESQKLSAQSRKRVYRTAIATPKDAVKKAKTLTKQEKNYMTDNDIMSID